MSQAPQHFSFSDSFVVVSFFHLVFSLSLSRTVDSLAFLLLDVGQWHMLVGLYISVILFFVASSLNLLRLYHVWSDRHYPTECTCDYIHVPLRRQAGGSYIICCTAFDEGDDEVMLNVLRCQLTY